MMPAGKIIGNYPMDRAVRTAESAGFSSVRHLAAPSSLIQYGANMMWEVVMELNELTLRK